MEKYLNRFYDVIDKIGKHNFILIIFIFVALLSTGFYQTFSMYTESEGLSILDNIKTYSFILKNNGEENSVVIAPNSSKNIDITVTNESEIDLRYGLYSSIDPNDKKNIFLGYSSLTKYSSTGVITSMNSYVITIKIYNYSSEEKVIDFGLKYGFLNDEDLVLDENQYWVESLYMMKNLYSNWNSDYNYYRADEYRNNIVSASFVDLDAIAESESLDNAVISWNISAYGESDDSVVAWLIENSTSTGTSNPYYDLYIGSNEKIYTQSLYALFSQMSALETVSFDNLDTSMATDMSFLFRACSNLKGNTYGTNGWVMELSSFNTSNVTNMWSLFCDCKMISSINLEGFDTSNVTNMRTMFCGCDNLMNLNLSTFDTGNVTTMVQMFAYSSKLVSDNQQTEIKEGLIFGEGFKTDSVTDMSYMFSYCHGLTTLDLNNWDTSNVTNMGFMFDNCINLINLKFSNKFVTTNVISFEQMFYYCRKLNTTIFILESVSSPNYSKMFEGAATESGANINVYFSGNTMALVNNMITTKSVASNINAMPYVFVAPGTNLAEAPIGSYIRYIGNNGCDDINIVNGYTSCSGKNARYVDDSNKGWCVSSSKKFKFNGWRIGYVREGETYLISAGVTDCLCTDSNGSISDTTCNSYFDANNLYKHFNNMDNIALKYCNTTYAKNGVCDNTTAWAMDAIDFEAITGVPLNDNSCYNVSNSVECGYNNSLIDINGYYWFKTVYFTSPHGAFIWEPNYRYVAIYNSSSPSGVRPVLVLDSSVYITGGAGTYEDPYTISIE